MLRKASLLLSLLILLPVIAFAGFETTGVSVWMLSGPGGTTVFQASAGTGVSMVGSGQWFFPNTFLVTASGVTFPSGVSVTGGQVYITGKVGISTPSIVSTAVLQATTTGGKHFVLGWPSSVTNRYGGIYFMENTSALGGYLQVGSVPIVWGGAADRAYNSEFSNYVNDTNAGIGFWTTDGSGTARRLKIGYSGNVIIGSGPPSSSKLDVQGLISSISGVSTAGYYSSGVSAYNANSGVTIDWNKQNHVVTLSQAGTSIWWVNTPTDGLVRSTRIKLLQDSTGSRTVVWTGQCAMASGVSPTLTTRPSGYDLLTAVYGLSGTTIDVVAGPFDMK